ncbi:13477_t:CDS:2 [Entrophospora sp. SA101]|nr:13477_t:CDS:2 [Entrophospora sp. SA101]
MLIGTADTEVNSCIKGHACRSSEDLHDCAVECINPSCISFKRGYTTKPRDSHSAAAISIAVYQDCSQLPIPFYLPPFSRTYTPTQPTLRGGKITFHGPGQLVCYPILNLNNFKLSVRSYVASIEKLIIDTCSEYKIKARTTKDTGVWVENEKICAIGIQVQRFITSHGFALNCNTDLRWFNHIIPCGIEGKSVTSITKELNKRGGETNQEISVEQVLPILFKKFNTLLGGGDNGVAIRQLMPLNELSHIEIYNKLNIEIKKIAK